MAGAAAAAGTSVGVGGLGGGSQGEAAAVQVQSMGHVGQPPQACKLAVDLFYLTLYLHQAHKQAVNMMSDIKGMLLTDNIR